MDLSTFSEILIDDELQQAIIFYSALVSFYDNKFYAWEKTSSKDGFVNFNSYRIIYSLEVLLK